VSVTNRCKGSAQGFGIKRYPDFEQNSVMKLARHHQMLSQKSGLGGTKPEVTCGLSVADGWRNRFA
tara:strand:+ start:369 stop:566 length:198 start_codon:yes stop_codon:yes gene_type:complete